MDGDERRPSLGSFLLGGLIGGAAGLAAARLKARGRRVRQPTPPGLTAFEQAPCFQELLEREPEWRV